MNFQQLVKFKEGTYLTSVRWLPPFFHGLFCFYIKTEQENGGFRNLINHLQID